MRRILHPPWGPRAGRAKAEPDAALRESQTAAECRIVAPPSKADSYHRPVEFGLESSSLAHRLSGARFGEGDLYVRINAFWEPVCFQIQEGETGRRTRIVDTSRPSPEDVQERESCEQ